MLTTDGRRQLSNPPASWCFENCSLAIAASSRVEVTKVAPFSSQEKRSGQARRMKCSCITNYRLPVTSDNQKNGGIENNAAKQRFRGLVSRRGAPGRYGRAGRN